MALRESAGRLRSGSAWTVLVGGRDWLLGAAIALNCIGYLSWFVVLHLHSVGWAPGQVLDLFPGYWAWFYRVVFTEDEVFAARRSALAARHAVLQGAAWLVLGGGYIALMYRLRAIAQLRLRTLIGLACLFSMPLLLLPNLLSGDVYSYISFGRIATVYGANPFIDPPAAFPGDAYFHWVGWTRVPSVYGPAWIYPSMLLTVLVESTVPHVVTYVLAYKLLALVLHLANGLLIWSILSYWRREQRVWGTALYLLNPLALTEFVGNGHNDVLMITFILVAIWLHLRGRWLTAAAALTLAVLTKWIALPVLGLYALMLLWQGRGLRQRLRYAVGSAAVFASLCVALYAPYWEAQDNWSAPGGRYTLRVLFDAPPQKRLINSIGEAVATEYSRVLWYLGKGPNPALVDVVPMTIPMGTLLGDNTEREGWVSQQNVRYSRYVRDQKLLRDQVVADQTQVQNRVRWAALALLGVVCVAGVALTRNLRTLLLAGAWILFTYITIGAVWVWPWYATWFVALAALLDWRVTGRTAILLSVLALVIYPLYPIMPDGNLLERLRGVVAFGPPLVFALWQGVGVLRRLRRGELRLDDERAFA